MAKETVKTGNFRKSPPKSGAEKKLGSGPFWKDRRFHLSLGFLLIALSIFMLFAFVSYLFAAPYDQSVVRDISWDNVREQMGQIQNKLSLAGAFLSHYLIFKWFGPGAFFLVPIFFALGVRILFKPVILPFGRILGFSFFAMIWLSLLAGYLDVLDITGENLSLFTGGIGFALGSILNDFMGIGTPLLLLVSLLIFIIFFFDVKELPTFSFGRKSNTSEESDEEDENEPIRGKIPFNPEKKSEIIPLGNSEQDGEEEEDGFPNPGLIPEGAEDETKNWELKIKPISAPKPEKPSKTLEVEINQEPITPSPVFAEINGREGDEEIDPLSIPYDPTLDLSSYRMPGTELLEEQAADRVEVTRAELEENKNKIVETLESFQIGIDSIRATIGPTVTLYEIIPKAGVKISKIRNLEDDIALNLAALGIRIIAPIPGRGTIGIEVPNKNRQLVGMKALLETEKFQNTTMELPVILGKTISNEAFMVDLAKMPHLLMAGATGQGKSVGLNVLLTSLLYKKHPSQLKLVLVDPKKVELTLYNKIERHFLAMLPDAEEAIITDTRKVVNTLNSLCIEMDNRYTLLKDAGCRNLKEYNAKFLSRRLNPENGHRFLPYIVLVIDELADLMMTAGKEVETPIARLAQLARAIGIHLVLATQRPSVNVITGIIKANFPARLSFRVTSKVDSRVVLDGGGAEQLIGMGDMLLSMGSEVTRLQCAFIDTSEVDAVCDFIGQQRGYPSAYLLPEYFGEDGDGKVSDIDLSDRDDMFEEAARLIVQHQQGSTSLIQRKLKLGYNRAGRLIDQLEAAGVVGPFEGSKAREVLIQDQYALEQLLRDLDGK
jgi:S-DNA-T family DNA segregation ATPase FtsK/SpoIIIE